MVATVRKFSNYKNNTDCEGGDGFFAYTGGEAWRA